MLALRLDGGDQQVVLGSGAILTGGADLSVQAQHITVAPGTVVDTRGSDRTGDIALTTLNRGRPGERQPDRRRGQPDRPGGIPRRQRHQPHLGPQPRRHQRGRVGHRRVAEQRRRDDDLQRRRSRRHGRRRRRLGPRGQRRHGPPGGPECGCLRRPADGVGHEPGRAAPITSTNLAGAAASGAQLTRTTRATIDGLAIAAPRILLAADASGALTVQSTGTAGSRTGNGGDLATLVYARLPSAGTVAAGRVATDTQALVGSGASVGVDGNPLTIRAGSSLTSQVSAQGPGSVAALVVDDTTNAALADGAALRNVGDLTVQADTTDARVSTGEPGSASCRRVSRRPPPSAPATR